MIACCSDKFEVTPQSVPYLAGMMQDYFALCLLTFVPKDSIINSIAVSLLAHLPLSLTDSVELEC